MEKLKESGQTELSNQIQKIHELIGENRMKEKQIISLVKDTNKLQDVNEYLEKENCILRYILKQNSTVTPFFFFSILYFLVNLPLSQFFLLLSSVLCSI